MGKGEVSKRLQRGAFFGERNVRNACNGQRVACELAMRKTRVTVAFGRSPLRTHVSRACIHLLGALIGMSNQSLTRHSINQSGELALLSSDKRAATVTATKKTAVLMLGRQVGQA